MGWGKKRVRKQFPELRIKKNVCDLAKPQGRGGERSVRCGEQKSKYHRLRKGCA